jgi:hypothetical protein
MKSKNKGMLKQDVATDILLFLFLYRIGNRFQKRPSFLNPMCGITIESVTEVKFLNKVII